MVCAGADPAPRVQGRGPQEVRAGGQAWRVGSDTASRDEDVEAAIEQAFVSGARPPDGDVAACARLEADGFELFRALTVR